MSQPKRSVPPKRDESSNETIADRRAAGVTAADTASVPVRREIVADRIPMALRRLPRWVVWRYERLPNGKLTKVPSSPATGRAMDATKVAKGVAFADALTTLAKFPKMAGVGFILGGGIGGVDVDDCIIDGAMDERGQRISAMFAATYAEVSPSGTGFKAFMLIGDDAELAAVHYNKDDLELYGSKRFFTVTSQRLEGHTPRVARMAGTFRALAAEVGALRPAKPEQPDDGPPSSGRWAHFKPGITLDQVREALRLISADCSNKQWFDRGRAIELQFGSDGFEVWVEWSATSDTKFPGREACAKEWARFKRDNDALSEHDVPFTVLTIISDAPKTSAPAAKPNGSRELVIIGADTIDPASVNWLWPGRLPRKFLTVFAADGGSGKTTATAAIAATLTSGAPWPNDADLLANRRPPYWVLWLGIEDPLAEVTVPRLHAAGAVLSRVRFVTGTRRTGSDGIELFSIQDDLDLLRATLHAMRAAGNEVGLIVVDPVTSYLHGKRRINPYVATELRSVLQPFATLCDEEDLALICITHLTKDKSRGFVDSVMGSGALTQLSRNVWGFAHVPEEADNSYAMFYGKGNLGKPGITIRYSLHGASLTKADGEIIETSKVVWGRDEPTLTKEALLGGSRGPAPFARQEIAAWLRAYLGDGAWHPADQVRAAALAEGFSIGSLRRVTDDLCERERWSGVWMWSMPSIKTTNK